MLRIKKSGLIMCGIVAVLAWYLGLKMSMLYGMSGGELWVDKVQYVIHNLRNELLHNPLRFNGHINFIFAFYCAFAVIAGYFLKAVMWKNYRPHEEHGSARWGTKQDAKPFIDPIPQKNMILTETESMSLSNRMKFTETEDYNRNKNVLVIGGTGAGKTRYHVKPNLMQMNCSFVTADSKGLVLAECGAMHARNGYDIKVLNLKDPAKSDHYNPLAYLKSEIDIYKLVDNIISNTTPKNTGNKDDFWEKAERAFLMACIGYLYYRANKEDQNIPTLLYLIDAAEAKDENEDYVSALDVLFQEYEKTDYNSFPCRMYRAFKSGAGKTIKSIIVSVKVRLAPFSIDDISSLLYEDTIDFSTIGEKKTALYIVLPDTHKSFNFLAAIMYQQLLDTLIDKADNEYKGGSLPIHVKFMLDEFANTGQIPNFELVTSTIRSRNISVTILIQAISQLKALYKNTWETIVGNCDSLLYLGGNEPSTKKFISEQIDKETVDTKTSQVQKGANGHFTSNAQNTGRALITPGEVGTLSRRKCILIISGCPPFKSKKYDIRKHPNYNQIADYSDDNFFEFQQRANFKTQCMLENIEEIKYVDLSELNELAPKVSE